MQPTEMMVRIQNGKNLDDYSVENTDGFLREVTPRLPKMGFLNRTAVLDWEQLPYYSAEVLAGLPAEDLRYLCLKYGKPMQKGEFERKLYEGKWITSPNMQTIFVAALTSMYSDSKVPDRYAILRKAIEQ